MVASVPCERQIGKILVVVHQRTSTPGRIGMKLAARGYALDIRRPVIGHPLPERLDDHAGLVIFGGPQSANDDEPYLHDEIDLIGRALDQGAPTLGVCLGAQLMVRQLGGKVTPHPEGRAEVGYYPIRPTAAGIAVTPDWPDHVYQWHREGFEVPAGATLLAESDGDFPVQAIGVGASAFGIQFHPEVTKAMMHRWTVLAEERMDAPGAQPRSEHISGRFLHDGAIDAWLEAFLDAWLARDARERKAAAE